MFQALTPEQVSFCASRMQQYVDPRGRSQPAGYDYVGFINSYFGNWEPAFSGSENLDVVGSTGGWRR